MFQNSRSNELQIDFSIRLLHFSFSGRICTGEFKIHHQNSIFKNQRHKITVVKSGLKKAAYIRAEQLVPIVYYVYIVNIPIQSSRPLNFKFELLV